MAARVSILVFLSAIALTTSCAKVEMSTPKDMPVAYQVIQDIAHSKAGELEYDKSIPFKSSAFYLDEGEWSTDKDNATSYIDKATISYNPVENKWRNWSEIYYWPKTGSLTFFSWSPASISDSKISVDKTKGVCLSDWNTAENRTIDFLVADVVYDKSSNETSYFYNGVPTLFRHQLAKISFFVHLEKAEAGKWTKIKKAYLTNIYAQADYEDSNWTGWEDKKDEWVIYESSDGMDLTIESKQIGGDMYMIPQNLAEAVGRGMPEIVIVYDNEGGTDISKSFSFTDDINSYFWAKGTTTRYSISYGTSDKPIDFETDVKNWSNYGNNDINIGQM